MKVFGSYEVRRPKVRRRCLRGVSQGGSRGIDAESRGSRLTLGRTGGDPWWTLIGMLFAKRSTKELKAASGRNCTITTKK